MMTALYGVIWLWIVIRAVIDRPVEGAVVIGGALALMVCLKLLTSPKP